MVSARYAAYRAALEILYFSGISRAVQPLTRGIGAILMLHHVKPERRDAFQPNRGLEVDPDFLESLILHLRRRKIDFISLDEARRRLVEQDPGRPFVALTFDDGYRDNLEYALPVLKRHGVPFTIYVATSFPDGRGELWWEALERMIAKASRLVVEIEGADRVVECADTGQKYRAYAEISAWLPGKTYGLERQYVLRDLAAREGFDLQAQCRELCMDWSELANLAKDPLCSIGAHTVNHVFLRNVPPAIARDEMRLSADSIEAALGSRPVHFAYPYGGLAAAGPNEYALAAELGYQTGVTTRRGVLLHDHRAHLTSLPRIFLNGNLQKPRYVEVMTSGVRTPW